MNGRAGDGSAGDGSAGDILIRCRAVTKVYRKGAIEIVPLQALDLDIRRGEYLSLMGPSGSGKTTLLNLLAGIDECTAGTLEIGGALVSAMSRGELARWRSRTVGIIFQSYNLVPVLTALENVELPLMLHGLGRRERIRRAQAALDTVGLSDRADHFPRQLSGGQEQRVAIARAIVADPPLLLADEPTGDLDRENAAMILALLDHLHRERGTTIVMVTHDPAAAARASLRLHLDKGRLADDAGTRAGVEVHAAGSQPHDARGGGSA